MLATGRAKIRSGGRARPSPTYDMKSKPGSVRRPTIGNIFNLDEQNQEIDLKLAATMERVVTLFRSSIQDVSKLYGLTPLQLQLLIFVAEHKSELCTVSSLAQELQVTKATISDSVRSLAGKGLVEKLLNPRDARGYSLRMTDQGISEYANIQKHPLGIASNLSILTADQKVVLLESLMALLSESLEKGDIPIRACISCSHYRKTDSGFHCALLGKDLPNTALRLDCPEHSK